MAIILPKPKIKSAATKKFEKSIGKFVMPKKDVAKGRVLTGPQARAEQEKKTKKRLKGGYSNANKI